MLVDRVASHWGIVEPEHKKSTDIEERKLTQVRESKERDKDSQTLNCALGMCWRCLSAPITLGLVGSQPSETFSMCANISTGGLAHIIRISKCEGFMQKPVSVYHWKIPILHIFHVS